MELPVAAQVTTIGPGEDGGRVLIQRLKPNSIGPIGLAALAIGVMSPALGLYALWPPIQAETGPIAPLIYFLAMFLALPTAASYAVLNAEAPAAGAGSTWLWQSVSPIAGYVAGLSMATYFLTAAVAQPLIFSLFANDLLVFLGFGAGGKLFSIACIFVSTAPIVLMTRKGVETSIKTAVILMAIESIVVVALAATIFWVKAKVPGGINLGAFHPGSATGGLPGFWRALILGVLAFGGFDIVSTAAEETHAPRKHVPRAIFYTILGITVFWVINSWAYTLAAPASVVQAFAEKATTAVTPLAAMYWGRGNIFIILTAFTGIGAIYISCVLATSRIIFALARHELLPKGLAKLHPVHRVPSAAMAFVFAVVMVSCAITFKVLGNGLTGFIWWSNVTGFFFLLTFIGVNFANIFYFWRVSTARFKPMVNLVLPAVGIVLDIWLIYRVFFGVLWHDRSPSGRSVVIACMALFAFWIACAVGLRLIVPKRLSGPPPIGAD